MELYIKDVGDITYKCELIARRSRSNLQRLLRRHGACPERSEWVPPRNDIEGGVRI